MSDFNKDLNIGKIGEEAVASYMATRNHSVIDVSDDADYRKIDIDLLLTNKQGQKCSVEVKSDKRIGDTCNFCIEECNERETGNYKGWYHYCEADYVCFYDYLTGYGYVIDWKKARPHIKEKAQYSAFENRGDGGISWCYLLSIGTAKREGWLIHRFKYEVLQ